MATKSLIETVRIETALKAHNCQANQAHRVNKGDVRLKVRDGLGWAHYCKECALKIIDKDIAKLNKLRDLQPQDEQ